MEKEGKNKSRVVEYCFHCGLPAKNSYKAFVEDEEQLFCCNGCITACQLIYSSGAGSYYKNRTNFSETPVKTELISLPYESEKFYLDYIKQENNNYSVKLYIESIHCPSCIWVIEKVLEKEFAITNVSINFTAKTVKIVWNKNQINLKDIINTLSNIGYLPQPVETINLEDKMSQANKTLLLKMVISGFGMLSTMFLSEPFYFKYVQDLNQDSANLLKYISLILTTPIYFYCISTFFKSFISTIKYKILSMDSSIFIGATLIFLYSVWGVFTNKHQVYFDCLTMFLFLILTGRFIEASVKENIFIKVNQSIKNYPKQSILITDNTEKVIYTKDIKVDDVILIKPGEQIPVDGTIVYGSGYVNESVMTGESKPLYKSENNKVIAGAINLEGAFYVKVEKIGNETTLNQIIDLSDNISSSKNKLNLLTDKASHWLILTSLLCAVLAFFINLQNGSDIALLSAVSVIVVTCPCALGLAIPASISMASSMGIKKGILFKNSNSFELINKTKNIVFDKTGTITYGDMKVSEIKCFDNYTENNILELASAVERYSEHPIAKAIVSKLNSEKLNIIKAQDFINVSGQGVKGILNGNVIIVGKKEFLDQHNIKIPSIDNINLTPVFVAYKNQLIGIIYLSDQLKKDAISIISSLKSKNINTYLLSGDKNNVVKNIAELSGINHYAGEMKPEEKAEYIKHLHPYTSFKGGISFPMTMMIGDGINDTPAMAASDISVAITSSNDLTNLKADIVILNKEFSAINDIFDISAKTFKIIKQNIFLSFLYNLIMIPLAINGYVSPLIAAILMPVSSFIVLFNSLKILRGEK